MFANWVIQLIYQYATYQECKQIVFQLKDRVLELSLNGFGCRLIKNKQHTTNPSDMS